jgi:transposase InsO family protein
MPPTSNSTTQEGRHAFRLGETGNRDGETMAQGSRSPTMSPSQSPAHVQSNKVSHGENVNPMDQRNIMRDLTTAIKDAISANSGFTYPQVPNFDAPSFTGDPSECFDDFIRDVNDYAIYMGWNDAHKLSALPMLLRQQAKRAYQDMEEGNKSTWEQAIHRLRLLIGPDEHQAELAFNKLDRMQQPNEPVTDYSNDMDTMLRRAKISDERQKILFFKRGLLPPIRAQLAFTEARTLVECQRKAQIAEHSLKDHDKFQSSLLQEKVTSLTKMAIQQAMDQVTQETRSEVSNLNHPIADMRTNDTGAESGIYSCDDSKSPNPMEDLQHESPDYHQFDSCGRSFNRGDVPSEHYPHRHNLHQGQASNHVQGIFQGQVNIHGQGSHQGRTNDQGQRIVRHEPNYPFCRQCNMSHPFGQHQNPTCASCGTKGHTRGTCKQQHNPTIGHSTNSSPVQSITFTSDCLVPVIIKQSKYQALLDTGSSVNCISEETLHATQLSLQQIQQTDQNFSTASGSSLNPTGMIYLRFWLNNRRFEDTFYIFKNLSQQIILGRPFMHRHEATLDLHQNKCTFNERIKIYANKDVFLRPAESILIQGVASKVTPDGLHGSVGANAHFSGATIVAAAVTICNNKVPLLLTNEKDYNIRLDKGQYVTYFKPLSSSECPMEPKPHKNNSTNINHINPHGSREDKDPIEELKDEYNIDLMQYDPEGRQTLVRTLHSNKEAFTDSSGKLGYNDWFSYRIQLQPNTRPLTRQPYRMSPEVKQALQEQIDQFVEQGVLTRSHSTWSSPVIAIKKGTSKARKHVTPTQPAEYRLVVDYRYLNAHCLPPQTHLSNVRELLDEIGQSSPRWFTSLDVKNSFFQHALHPDSRHLTSFLFNHKAYEFRVCPQGLHASPHVYSRLMLEIMDIIGEHNHVFCYIDDILIATPTWEKHIEVLDKTLKAFRQANLKLNGRKCRFAEKEATFLGYQLTEQGISIGCKHVRAIQTWPQPKTPRQVRSLLGSVNYFRQWIPDRGKIIKPLTQLTRKDVKFRWTEECQNSFDQIKQIMSSQPILAYPNFDKEFELFTDASQTAIGALLAQRDENNQLRAVSYLGRGTSRQESHWNITELEALSVVYAVREFRVYLSSKPFKVYTDHAALIHIFNSTKIPATNKLTRYALYLSDFQYEIIHVPGPNNVIADALSRRTYEDRTDAESWEDPSFDIGLPQLEDPVPINQRDPEVAIVTRAMAKRGNQGTASQQEARIPENTSNEEVPSATNDAPTPAKETAADVATQPTEEKGAKHSLYEDPTQEFLSNEAIRKAQEQDEFCNDLLNLVLHDVLPEDKKRRERCLKRQFDFCVRNEMLCQIWNPIPKGDIIYRILIPQSLQHALIDFVHHHAMSAHLGSDKMISLLRRRVIFKNMYQLVQDYIGSCDTCLRVKQNSHPFKVPTGLYDPSPQPWERCHVDFAGPFQPTRYHGNRYICTVVDSCSSFVVAWACRTLTATSFVENFYERVSCVFGNPEVLVADNAQTFKSKLWLDLAARMNIKMRFSPPYFPKNNGLAESAVKRIKQTLQLMSQNFSDSWDKLLPPAVYAMNANNHGNLDISPYTILFGRTPKVVLEQKSEHEPAPLYSIIDDMLTTQAQAQTTVSEYKRQKATSNVERSLPREPQQTLLPGDVVFWNKPTDHTIDGVHRQRFVGPYIVFGKIGNRVRLRHLDSGQFHPLLVHISQLRKAPRYQINPHQNQFAPASGN